MARKRRRGGRRGLPKTAGGWVSLGFKVAGGLVAAGPAIGAVKDSLGAPEQIPGTILYRYTGILPGQNQLNIGQLTYGVGSIAGGVLLAKVGSMLGKMIH